jgi:DedD protein
MKIVLDERLKHRLIGLAVILSLAAIFAPAIMKKSAQHMEKDIGMRMQLPAKPALPSVAVKKEKEVFKSVKVAHVKLPELPPVSVEQVETKLVKIDMAHSKARKLAKGTADAALPPSTARTQFAEAPPQKLEKPTLTVTKKIAEKRGQAKSAPASSAIANNQLVYSVQLASFAHRQNALVLVNKLKSKGYIARIDKISSKQGDQYKVFVGKSREREQALKLKNQLANGMQLHGFVVTGAG